jgi:hypothetical protein
MITLDRSPRGNHLKQSIDSLKNSGLFEHSSFQFILSHSGENTNNLKEAQAVHSKLNIATNKELLNYNNAVTRGIELALETRPDLVLFMEDDIKVCQNFPQFVLDTYKLTDNTETILDFVSYYEEITDAYFQGKQLIEMLAKNFYGGQCFSMNTLSAASFSQYIRNHIDIKEGFCDVWIEDWLLSQNLEPIIKCAVPSGAQHTGKNSTHGHPFFEAPCFKDDIELIKPRITNQFEFIREEKNEMIGNSFIFKRTNSNHEISLNQSAYLIYLFCDGEHALKQIFDDIHIQLGGDKYTLDTQIRQGLATLKSQQLIHYSTLE